MTSSEPTDRDAAPLVALVDRGGPGRTTGHLVASLQARIETLQVITGAQAMGSLLAGLGALGREAARTAEGARLRDKLCAGRVAVNGRVLWNHFGTDAVAGVSPPSPVLVDLRNDLALMLAPDLPDVLARQPGAGEALGPVHPPADFDAVDIVVGLWAYAREVVGAVEQIADVTRGSGSTVRPAEPSAPEGPMLR
jgi:hypothetical protein